VAAVVDEYSIWLLPVAAQQDELTALVRDLAQAHGTEPFIPHVTIQGDIKRPLADVEPVIAAMASRWPAQRWAVSAVEGTDHFFRSLFLRFAATPAYEGCKAVARECTGTADGLSMFPHLSLAYGINDPAAKQAAINALAAWNHRDILFDRIVIARSSSAVAIADWAVLRSCVLAGAG